MGKLVFNPDVTVRARGVMEKCTYCVQRLRVKGPAAGPTTTDPQTACAQACATGAIVFGDLSKPTSRVAQLHRDSAAYAVLAELGTRPRTRYLPRITHCHDGLPENLA